MTNLLRLLLHLLHAICKTLNMVIMYMRSRHKKPDDTVLIKYKIYYKNTTTAAICKGNSYSKSVPMKQNYDDTKSSLVNLFEASVTVTQRRRDVCVH